jgi:HEAT repeat protein
MARTSDDAKLRKIIFLLGYLKCRRSVGALEALAKQLEPQIAMPEGDWGENTPEAALLNGVLMALGTIGSAQSQRVLTTFLQESQNPLVRADAMEAMGLARTFDQSLVWPYASMDASTPEILSALYALQFNSGRVGAVEVRERLEPLMQHEYGLVRAFTIEVLARNRVHRTFIASYADDPSEAVRQVVAEALRMIDA